MTEYRNGDLLLGSLQLRVLEVTRYWVGIVLKDQSGNLVIHRQYTAPGALRPVAKDKLGSYKIIILGNLHNLFEEEWFE